MNRLLIFSTLFSVLALSFSSLASNNRYGAPHSRNSLGHQGRYNSAPHAHSAPHQPRTPQAHRAPFASQSYGSSRNSGYGARQPGRGAPHSAPRQNVHHSAPNVHHAGYQQAALGPYGGGRHFSAAGPSLNHYSGPSHFPGPVPYGGASAGHGHGGASLGQAHASSVSNHYSSNKRSVYDQPQASSYSTGSRSNFPNQNYGHNQQHAQGSSTAQGREMKYTIRDPNNRGTTHVTETHVVSNRQMHGAEAEAAMKKLMGTMGSSSNGGFDDFFKDMGLPFY